ncbi:MAG: 50S ribosomal protein L18 [Candidatus Aenigmatarchaeota archaeon]
MRRTRAKRMVHRRRREKKTDYKLRLKLLKSGKKRLVVRKFNNNIVCQIVEHHPTGDKTVHSAEAKELRSFGWKAGLGNTPAAYLTGLLCGSRAKGTECILDLGLQTSSKGGKIYAALKGAADAGIKIPFSDDNIPGEDRISGAHIAKHPGVGEFTAYKKSGIDPKAITKNFEDTKAAINKSPVKKTTEKAPKTKAASKPKVAKKAAK